MAHLRRLRYVNSFVDRHGHARHYFRCEVMKAIRLPGPFGSEAFMLAYQMALAGLPDAVAKRESGVRRAEPGTIGALGVSYYRSDAWLNLDLETRHLQPHNREVPRTACCQARRPLRCQHVENMLKEIDGPSACRLWFKAIRPPLSGAVPTMLRDDPTLGIPTPKLLKTKGHHNLDRSPTLTGIAAIGRAEHSSGSYSSSAWKRCPVAARWCGSVCSMSAPGRRASCVSGIARIHGSDDVDIRVSPELMAAIEAMPRAHLTFIVTAYGRPRSRFGLGTDFAKWAREAGLPNHCCLHGPARSIGYAGVLMATPRTSLWPSPVAATLAEVERYTKGADKRKLADQGMAKRLRAQTENGQPTTPAAAEFQPSS